MVTNKHLILSYLSGTFFSYFTDDSDEFILRLSSVGHRMLYFPHSLANMFTDQQIKQIDNDNLFSYFTDGPHKFDL